MEENEQLHAQKVSDSVKDFVLRYNIDEAAAVALQSLPLGQQQEVTGQITGATNPSAVLLSRIKRLKQSLPPLAAVAAVAAVSPEATAAGLAGLAGSPAVATSAPPPPPDDTRGAVEAFLERHCINADACQSIWELSAEQQRSVISSDLVPTTGDAFDTLMDRISEILQGAKHSQYEADHQRHQKVSDFLTRYEISGDVALALRSLPLERQVEITSPDLTGAKNPSAVLMSRIQRKGHGKGDGVTSARGEVNAFLQAFQFDDDAKRSFLELRPEQQNLIMRDDGVGDYRRCRNPSAYLMSRIRAVKEGGLPTAVSSEGQWWEPPSGKTDVVETFLRRHNIDDGGREALHQLPAELQLRVLAHDHEIGQGGRNPSQHLVSLVGMAWAGTLGPPVPTMSPMPPMVPMAPIGAAVAPQQGELPQASLALDTPGEAATAAKPWEAEGEEAPAKKRKLEKLEEDEQLNNTFNDHLPLAVEGFLRLNGIDAKSCRAMRRLSPAAQQKLIGMDIRHRRNPSAFLWTQIQKLRDNHDDNEEEADRPERHRPPPIERQKPPALQNTSQNKVQKPQTSYPSRFSRPPSPPSPPKRREKGPKGDVAFFLIRHGKRSYVPPSVEICGGAPLTCGRARHHNDIEVLAQHVSKRHLEFQVQRGSAGEPILMVRDLSSNGTWVRGEKIQPGRLTRVVPGDIISLLPPNGEDVPAFQVMENADSVKAERMDEAMDYAPLAKPVAPPVDAPADGEVSEWIRSIGGGGKLSKRLIEEIEDSYDHLRQISENYRQNINEFLDVHAVEDADEQEVLWVAVSALCSWNEKTPFLVTPKAMDKALVKDIEYESKFNPETGLSVPQAAIWMVFITIFMDTLAATISTPALPYYARSFHVDNAAVGYLYASWSFTSAFCAPVLGQLADKFGRRTVLLASLLGAGLANLGQACAGTYYQLLGWRAFSGIWAAVGNSAQVYLSDVCSPLVLPDFMSKLSAVPSLAMTFGPGLGGGLSKFGLEIPVLVDGLLSLLAAGLCFIYLPESPVWLQSRGHAAAAASDPKAPSKVTTIPAGVRVLSISGFFSGINFGVVVSMTAIFLDAKLQFDSLHVGFTFVLSALATLATSIWITGFVQKSVGLKCCAVLGSLLNGLLSIAMAVIPGAWPTIIVMCLARVGMTLRAATNGTILANFTDPSNRGTIFAQQQFATNMGRLVGPVVAGHLAVRDPVLLPILFGSSCGLISGMILLAVPMPEGPKEVKQQRLRGFTDLGGAESVLELEYGTAQDCEELGKFMGDLLSQRRYRWISRKKAIYCMLDKLLPELSADVGDHLEDLQRLIKHVELIQKDFEGVQNRDVC